MTKEKLFQSLIDDGYLKTPLLIKAFQKIDRGDFVPENLKSLAYSNEPLPIGKGQTISQPLTVAFMLELLDPQPGEKILDIGSGSGWQTALLAYIVSQPLIHADKSQIDAEKNIKPAGRVVAIERILSLKAMTEENIKKYNFIAKKIVKVIWDDGSKGAPLTLKPVEGFDKIIAAASADVIPQMWKDQLKIGGRLVAPIGHSIFAVDKISKTEFKEEEHYGFIFVPLIQN